LEVVITDFANEIRSYRISKTQTSYKISNISGMFVVKNQGVML